MNTTKWYKLPLLIVITLLFIGCGSTETIVTHQKESSDIIEIDGELSDWPSSEANIKRSDYFGYYLMQDTEYLFVYVDFRNPSYNRAVENSGFILYLSDNKDEKNKRGFVYPVGAFNLLRDDPEAYRNMTRNSDWLGNAQNQQRLESLKDAIFDHVMIVDRLSGSSNAQYLHISSAQIEAHGMEFAVAQDRRYYGLEYKIPLDGSPPFELERGKTFWLGFSIEPPEFRFSNTSDMDRYDRRGQRGGMRQGQRRTAPNRDINSQLRRQMGLYDHWIKIEIQ